MRKILGCFIIIMIMITSQIFAATYYVDATNGNDSNNGTSPEIAWKTINKVNNSSFNSGDSILFKRGEIWREQLTIPSSSSPGNPITFGAYGSGDNPIINGSDIIKEWTNYSGDIWEATCYTEPDQVFFDGTRGNKQTALGDVDSEFDWFWESDVLYVYSTSDPDTAYTNPGVEATSRDYGIRTNANIDYIIIDNFQIERVETNCILLSNHSDHCIIQNCTFYQWGASASSNNGAVRIYGAYDTITANTFGKNTAQDADGPNWAGFKGIVLTTYSSDANITNNYFYHSGDETTASAFNGQSISVDVAAGTETISGNTIYHTGTHGIFVNADTNFGDVINIHDNTISYTGQAGICMWMSRGADGTGGIINVYNNTISYADRLAGTTAGSGNAACGIHLNDSGSPDPAHPFVHCNIYDNTVHNCQALASPGNEDSGGIALDYNVENANVYRNISYDNYGKGIYIYGGNNNNVYYNIFYGNDVGITVSAPDGQTADGNTIYNNVFYKNYNGDLGAGYNSEIWFGLRGDNNLIKNNILYADNNGYAYYYTPVDTSGCVTDYNCVFQDSGTLCYDNDNGAQTFSQWRANYPTWDANSVTTDPIMIDPANGDFKIQSNSPFIDAGVYVGLFQDYTRNTVPQGSGVDIGAYEYQGSISPLLTEINASPMSGYVPLAVSFTGSASGGTAPYSYSWDFGDGSSSSEQNTFHTYNSAGTYTVTITVTDSKSSQATDSLIITTSSYSTPLSASASASTTSGEAPLTVNFTGSASGGTAPYSYSWNFGDGASSTAQNPSHTYTQAGSYTATFTVTDSTASQASDSIAITASSTVHEVTVPDTPEGPSTGATGISYTYTTGGASCSQGHSVEYYFDWGDGAYSSWSSSTSASHIWSAAGTYTVKAQARCSVNPGVTSLWSEAKTVSLEESPNFQLYISSATDSPASGQGGSTNPDTGSYPYPAGNTAQVTALPATNYRFSKWTGDISGSDSYNSEITFNMDQDKSISALFCTQCGDVNGDLSITPADAQYVFEMFLGIISNATETQKENADVNCDGTATEPNITPADAQAIFEKFLGISELPGDCSCRSRADASSPAFTQNNRSQTAPLEIQPGTPNIQLTIDDIDARFKREITVPVRINNPFNIKSFGFDLIFDSGTLEFAGIEIGSLLNGFTMVDANEISEGVVRVGGFSSEPILTSSPSVLIRLKFRILGRAKEPSPLSITNTVDDIKNAATRPGVVFYKEINDKIMRNKNVF